MQLGMIGLGRMGGSMVIRLTKAGHECLVYDNHHEAVDALVAKGAKGTTSLPDFVKQLKEPRLVWPMVPAAAVDPVLESLLPLLDRGDIVVDGGNSYYHDDIRRAAAMREKGLQYVDVGVSVWLLDLAASALRKGPNLGNFEGRASDSGEGRWTLQAAIGESVPVISAALFARFSSRGEADSADRLLSALHFEFGGHVEKSKEAN
jgi:6-phosphogluconate dehydrogenase (decarboxylating)